MPDDAVLVAVKPLKKEFQDLNTIKLNVDEFTLGRSLDNSAVIAFLSLSRRHCIFRRKPDNSWTVEDQSTFGIQINEKKIGKGSEHALFHNDILRLEPTGEFVYKFIGANTKDTPPPKKQKISENDTTLEDAKQMFEESQSFEVETMKKRIKNAQDLHHTSIEMKKKLEEDTEQRIQELNTSFKEQIENLQGEKQEVERQKQILERERDAKMLEMRETMERKNSELQEQISRHTATEKELSDEISALRERLEREREEFLAALRESAGREELMKQLQEKCRQQEEAREKERKQMQQSLREIEARADEEKKLRESKEKSLEDLKKRYAEKELEDTKSKQQVDVLQQQLDQVKTELECEKIVRMFAGEAGPSAANEGVAVRSRFGELLESELQCTVCADLLVAAVTLGCSHTFCKYCIAQWKKKKKDCPICRTPITSECRSLLFDSFIEKMVENLNDEMKQKRMQILKDREELETQTAKEMAGTSRGRDDSDDAATSESVSGSGSHSDSSTRWEGELDEDDYDDYYDRRYNSRYNRREYFDYDDSGSDQDTASDEESPATAATILAGPDTAGGSVGSAAVAGAGDPGGRTRIVDNGEPGGSAAGASGDRSAGAAAGSGASNAGAVEHSSDSGSGSRRRASRSSATSRTRSRQTVAGVPGSYYGGYGRCYNCGARGHWAPGCPLSH